MAERVFRRADVYDQEVDQSAVLESGPSGTPAGLIGTSLRGPAFVPKTVRNFNKFKELFGDLNVKHFAPYAAEQFLKNKNSLTFCRVLGAGANQNTTDISNTVRTGQVLNAGFLVTGTAIDDGRLRGSTQLLCARHTVQANEAFGINLFTNNDSFTQGASINAHLVRGIVFCATSSRIMVLDGNQQLSSSIFTGITPDDLATVSSGLFKLCISSTLGASYATTDGVPGIRALSCSLNPTSANYISKILNTDPEKFATEQHLLYADYAVDDEIAQPATVAILSGTTTVSRDSGDTTMAFRDVFGHFDTRYTAPKTSYFISQPFGATEYDLFYVEALDDGEYANSIYKVSIAGLKASIDDKNPFGTFSVLIRKWSDLDTDLEVLEQFNNCTLNPQDSNYVAKVIGDYKIKYNFDAEQESEQRLVISGKYPNRSKYVRVVMNNEVEEGRIPQKALPFGFRSPELLKTNDALTDSPGTNPRLAGYIEANGFATTSRQLTGSIVPPVPFRMKVTRGSVATSGPLGSPGTSEIVNSSYFWGVKFERNISPLDPNTTTEKNNLLSTFTKFHGIRKLDAVLTGSGADSQNNNKFTLARVAFGNTAVTDLTSSVNDHMKEAAYIRNGLVNATDYRVADGNLGSRVTLATLLAQTSSIDFNKFSQFAKFTTFMQGGFDGVNILDKNAKRLNDKAASFDLPGGAESTYTAPGLAYNPNGSGKLNNTVNSYIVATRIMTDPISVDHNILAIPGIREPFITDNALKKVKDYGMAIYIMDPVVYDDNENRLYFDSTSRPSVNRTIKKFEGRAIDNNYGAAYFPDIFITDSTNNRKVQSPGSIAALTAMGFNDRVAYPWFAPAGFNRASLDFVSNVHVRLNKNDKDRLGDARINPIANLPNNGGFVIFGQKTLQKARTALDRVNVRRLLLEMKRIITNVANGVIWEQNTQAIKNKFIAESTLQLGLIQNNAGIEDFRVIMDSSNNTDEDANNNKLNGIIIFIPTRAIEAIALDFIIKPSGVEFLD